MKNTKVKSKMRLIITTEQFKRLIDNVLSEQVLRNNKKLIKSITNANKWNFNS